MENNENRRKKRKNMRNKRGKTWETRGKQKGKKEKTEKHEKMKKDGKKEKTKGKQGKTWETKGKSGKKMKKRETVENMGHSRTDVQRTTNLMTTAQLLFLDTLLRKQRFGESAVLQSDCSYAGATYRPGTITHATLGQRGLPTPRPHLSRPSLSDAKSCTSDTGLLATPCPCWFVFAPCQQHQNDNSTTVHTMSQSLSLKFALEVTRHERTSLHVPLWTRNKHCLMRRPPALELTSVGAALGVLPPL